MTKLSEQLKDALLQAGVSGSSPDRSVLARQEHLSTLIDPIVRRFGDEVALLIRQKEDDQKELIESLSYAEERVEALQRMYDTLKAWSAENGAQVR